MNSPPMYSCGTVGQFENSCGECIVAEGKGWRQWGGPRSARLDALAHVGVREDVDALEWYALSLEHLIQDAVLLSTATV